MKSPNLFIISAFILLSGGCDSNNKSEGVVSNQSDSAIGDENKQVDLELKELENLILNGQSLENKMELRRLNFKAQTARKVEEEEAHLSANMDNYSATPSGVQAGMLQENFIKEVRIAGLESEKNLLKAFLPMKKELELSAEIISKHSRDLKKIRAQKVSLSNSIQKFKVYLNKHLSVRFPSQK